VAGDEEHEEQDEDGEQGHRGVEEEAAQGGGLAFLPGRFGGAGGEADGLLILEVVGELGGAGVTGAG
jgi:hypothetical protein